MSHVSKNITLFFSYNLIAFSVYYYNYYLYIKNTKYNSVYYYI